MEARTVRSRVSPRLADVRVNGIDRPLRLHLHTENDRYISEEIATLGQWESLETEVVRRLLGPGSLLLDCGANIGWYSVIGGGDRRGRCRFRTRAEQPRAPPPEHSGERT